MRKTIVAALAALMLLAGAQTAPSADAAVYRPYNVYNNSNHGMWFITGNSSTGPYKWVPAKTWSRDVNVYAVGVFTGSGYCTDVYQPANGGWWKVTWVRGPKRIALKHTSEWMVQEYACTGGNV
jgi:hypothetical protein